MEEQQKETLDQEVTNFNKETTKGADCTESAINTPKKCHSQFFHIGMYAILAIAIIVLYILHFTAPKQDTFTPKPFTGAPGSGEIVYINLDSINANYKLINILQKDIEAEMARQESIFANKEKALQQKVMQFEQNYQSGVLTQVQVENTQMQLEKEYQTLEMEKSQVMENLQYRQMAAVEQMYDSLQKATLRINGERNASYILSYQKSTPYVILADPSKEITQEVIFELNKTLKTEE